jgi:6-phosphogluconolactonase/glucosamine-6-phosphate isomerase/deaminase
MVINIVKSLAEPVGNLWRELQASHDGNDFSVASPLSSTPLPIYEWVIKSAESFSNWEQVNFILMDEQVEGRSAPFTYIPTDDDASYEGFACKHLLDPLRTETGTSIDVLKPDLGVIDSFAPSIDLLILALGVRGNYANVMPGTEKNAGWHIAHLSSEFRQSHTHKDSQSYANAEFREFGMSLGPQQVLAAKHVVVIISGPQKRELAERLLAHKKFDPEFPLSIIFEKEVEDRVQVYIAEDVGINNGSAK